MGPKWPDRWLREVALGGGWGPWTEMLLPEFKAEALFKVFVVRASMSSKDENAWLVLC